MKIGEVISASVLGGIDTKLELDNPEDLRVGYPIIVEGKRYDFYCLIQDIRNPPAGIIEQIAGSELGGSVVPMISPGIHEGYGGQIFFSKALLKPIQLIDDVGKLHEPETIPPYFSEVRMAVREDVQKIYQSTETTMPIGSLRGIPDFEIPLDFASLTEKPFAIFGRTGMGKTILCKIVCNSILAKDTASILLFDMHQEYGMYSKSDNSPGLKFFFPHKVEMFSLDPSNTEARPFVISPKEITPSDIIVAFQDLSDPMADALYCLDRTKGDKDLITAILNATPDSDERIHAGALQALRRRIARMDRFDFVKDTSHDIFSHIMSLIQAKRSIVLDFGKYGRDMTAYLFIANILARRLYDLYSESEKDDLPRLVLFIEEAHKFLDPRIASYTVLSILARETRKFNLVLALIDQRPSRIDDEVRSQLANRLILSLKEPNDITSALAGIPDRSAWEGVVGAIPARTVLAVGDAIRVPTVIEIMEYNTNFMRRFTDNMNSSEISDLSKDVDRIFE
ncbi:MAG: ATP-binding protein [Methanocellales archaeon]|nr:ATP-binding protein [Methanocellales archaeon]MDD5447486.1 ATP-binding protein [Methanocellales archaeon]